MQFDVEKTQLADRPFEPLRNRLDVSFHHAEAKDVDEALRLFIRKDHSLLVGEVQKFPGSQIVATVRKDQRIYMLQLSPRDEDRT